MRLLAISACLVVLGACGGKDADNGRNGGMGTAGTSAGTGAGTTAGTQTTAGQGGGVSGTMASTAGVGVAGAGAGVGTAGTGPIDLFAGNNAVTPGTICDRMSQIQCAGEVNCCDTPRTYEACKADMMNGCMSMLFLDEIAMNAITGFDAVAANTAFNQYETMARACDPNVAEWGSSITGLRSILKGTVAAGDSCPIKASDATSKAAAALASCLDGANTACMFNTIGSVTFPINWTCDARAGDGAKCFTDANCLDGLYCDNPDVKFNAVCKPRKAVGSPCEFPNECSTLFCKKKVCAEKNQQSAYCLRND